MALENLTPENRVERLLSGADLEPATRLEYFLKQAGSGGSGSVEYEPVLAETTKSVTEHGWTESFSGGPIFEGTSYRVIVNGVTYEPLVGTAGDLSYVCLGNTYVDDSNPSGDYPFGIFYKNDTLTAWLETGESITMQIDQIIQLVPVPSPAAADNGKVLTANNGAVEWDTINEVPAGASGEEGFYLSLNNSLEPVWKQSVAVFNVTVSNEVYTCDTVWQIIKNRFMSGLTYVQIENDICAVVGVTEYPEANEYGIRVAMFNSLIDLGTNTPLGYPSIDLS